MRNLPLNLVITRLNFPSFQTCHVEIEADLVDSKDGEIWQSGVKERLKVSVLGSGLKRHPPVVGLSQITTTKVESR